MIAFLSKIAAWLLDFRLIGIGGLCRWNYKYSRWVRLEQAEAKPSQGFTDEPLISILLPVYNTPPDLLRRAIGSVLAQSYQRWELCICDDASTKLHVRESLEEFRQSDSRILVNYRPDNGHIAAASESALGLATGEFVTFLDHDDELAPDALYWLVAELNHNPEADIVYSDEDRLDEWGRRFDPHFKPDWNPDLFFSQNYLCHLTAIRTSLVHTAGGFRVGYDGSQDYDLFLRCLARTDSSRIRHIPRILYHWRAVVGSTSRDLAAKSYAADAGRRALCDYFAGVNPAVTVLAGAGATTYRVLYPLPESPPLVSIIIPTRDLAGMLRRCVDRIRAITDYPAYEIIIVDNDSVEPATADLFDELRRDSRVRVVSRSGAFNYAAINNRAVEEARGEVVCLLNNDVEPVNPAWLTELVRHALRPDVGAVGAKLYYPDGTVQHAGVVLGLLGIANHLHQFLPKRHGGYFGRLQVVQNVSAVTGACLAVRRELYLASGGLDAEHLPVAFNDVDFCLRLGEQGYRTLWTPFAELVHHESRSRKSDSRGEARQRLERESAWMRQRWGRLLEHDPCYNPNLSLGHRDFRPVWPPRRGES